MANTFPDNSHGVNFGSHIQLFTDARCTVVALVIDPTTKVPFPQGQVPVNSSIIAPFQHATATVLYARDNSGNIQSFYPHQGRTMPAVSGAKGGNSALASVVAALSGQGFVQDGTT